MHKHVAYNLTQLCALYSALSTFCSAVGSYGHGQRCLFVWLLLFLRVNVSAGMIFLNNFFLFKNISQLVTQLFISNVLYYFYLRRTRMKYVVLLYDLAWRRILQAQGGVGYFKEVERRSCDRKHGTASHMKNNNVPVSTSYKYKFDPHKMDSVKNDKRY